MKKFLAMILLVVCAMTAGVFVSCKESTYYKLTYSESVGVTYVSDVKNGAEVLDGATVSFTLDVENYMSGTPVVKAGDEVLTPNSDGVYSFTMTKDTIITVTELEALYNNVVFSATPGVRFTSELFSNLETSEGDAVTVEVLKNSTVSFGMDFSYLVEGTAVVKANDTVIDAGNDGNYSFSLESVVGSSNDACVITIDGIRLKNLCNVTFDYYQYVKFLSEDINVEGDDPIVEGTSIKFDVKESSYYADDYEVTANGEILSRGQDGKFSLTITEDTTIQILGLILDYNFTEREDGGSGTAYDPYRISRPVDLYMLSALINDSYYARTYNSCYYELVNDIDLEGDPLFIIGDQTDSTAIFAGVFDGKGHTISNFYIDDTFVEQTNYTEIFIPNIGMFGYVAPGATITNLNLSNFTIDVDADRFDTSFYAGGVVGFATGATISGCSVTDASISADADLGYFGYIGGIAGVMQSYFDGSSIRSYSTISSCYSNANIRVNSGYAYAAGGLVGLIASYEEKTNAFVLNSHFAGSVSGALYTGGIAGRLDGETCAIGCYNIGNVSSQTTIMETGSKEADVFAYAYAGGITGYADFNTVVSDSFSIGNINASAVSGTNFAYKGDIVGFENAGGTPYVNSRGAIVKNCYGRDNTDYSNDFLKNTLNWSESDWVFNDDGYPTVNYDETHKTFTLTFNFGAETVNEKSTVSTDITDMYIPMSYWYIMTDELGEEYVIPEFMNSDSGKRSYGYYFDANLTKRVPYSFVPTKDVTLYVGWASYSDVAGTYYAQTQRAGSGIKLELENDGTLRFIDGARIVDSSYTYDGEKIILLDTAIARLSSTTDATLIEYAQMYYYSYFASVEDGALKIWDNDYFPLGSELCAVKEISQFVYGKYVATGVNNTSSVYTFNTDGTGTITGAINDTFNYVVNGNSLTISRITAGVTRTGVIENGYVVRIANDNLVPIDKFYGVWETLATVHEKFSFDGKSQWSYEACGYNAQGEKVNVVTEQGSYEIVGDVLTLDNGYTATFGKDGNVQLIGEDKNLTLYRENSFVGTWKFNHMQEPVTIKLYGLSSEGYGLASITFAVNDTFEATYFSDGRNVIVFSGDVVLATLTYDVRTNTLKGTCLSLGNYVMRENATFCLYDEFGGNWVGYADEFASVTFNGYGGYNISGNKDDMTMSVNGVVLIDETTVRYSVSYADNTAKFTYNEVEYTAKYDYFTNKLVLTYGNGQSIELVKHDIWTNRVLIGSNAEGTVNYQISFDGKGLLSNGGKLTATMTLVGSNESETQEFIYKTIGDAIEIYNNGNDVEAFATITTNNGKFIFTVGGEETAQFTFKNAFSGEWLINGNRGTMTIGEIGNDLIANGTYLSQNVVFTYDETNGILTFTYSNANMIISVLGNGELLITKEGMQSANIGAIALSMQDEWKGQYVSKDGNTYLEFDGFGNSKYTSASALLKDSNGRTLNAYTYTVDKNGDVLIKMGIYNYKLFIPCSQDEEDAYQNGGVWYHIVAIDDFYLIKATDDEDNVYVFDGIGGVTKTSPDGLIVVNYDYEIVSNNIDKRTYTLTFTTELDETFTVTFDYKDHDNYTIKIEQNEEE